MDEWTCDDPDESLRRFCRSGCFGPGIDIRGELAEDTWLIHFSDHAASIASTGFTKGSPLDALSMALAYGARRSGPGYNFAFDAGDDYSIRTLSQYDFGGSKTQAVMFRAPGVAMTHYDGFNQVCFWGASARTPMFGLRAEISEDDDLAKEPHEHRWSVLNESGDVLETADDLFGAMDAVDALWEQRYRAVSEFPWSEHPTPTDLTSRRTVADILRAADETQISAVCTALRAWTWKALNSRRRDSELREWYSLLECVESRLAPTFREHAAQIRVLCELISESIAVAETVSVEQVLNRDGVRAILRLLCSSDGGQLNRMSIGLPLGWNNSALTRVLNLMSLAGLIERHPEERDAVFRLTCFGYQKATTPNP